MNELKVLHIVSGFGGGIASFVQNKAESLAKSNIIFDVLTFNEPPVNFIKAIEKVGGQIYKVSNPKETSFKIFYQEVSEVLSKQPDDVYIHSHIQGYRALPFYLIVKKMGYKNFGVHAHQSASPHIRSQSMKKMENLITNFIATQYLSCGKLASEFVFGKQVVEEKKVMHIPNSIDPDNYFRKINVPLKKIEVVGEQNKDKIVIGHVGRFTFLKNHVFMIEIIKELKKINDNFIWLFIGSGDLEKTIHTLAEQEGLMDNILFLGHRTDVSELYKVMDLFVLPSHNEGLPTVAVEAQAAGTQCLLSDSITDEVDLEMGLVEYLSIEEATEWAHKIATIKKVTVTPETRLNILHDKKFTNTESAELYQMFLEKKLSHYEI